MAQIIHTPAGSILCSRINAGSAEYGDLLVSDDQQRVIRVRGIAQQPGTGYALLRVNGSRGAWTIRIGINTPVWRATGARAAGII